MGKILMALAFTAMAALAAGALMLCLAAYNGITALNAVFS